MNWKLQNFYDEHSVLEKFARFRTFFLKTAVSCTPRSMRYSESDSSPCSVY